MTNFRELLRVLATAKAEFIIVGGVAAFAHGAARVTIDLDVVYRRTPENLARIVDALAPLSPYPRNVPAGLPFRWDSKTLSMGLNFTLQTTLGLIDLLGEITAGGGYDQLLKHTIEYEVYGVRCYCLDLDELIRVKLATARQKDIDAVAELEELRLERDEQDNNPA